MSSLRAESGVEGWGLRIQGCRTWHAWVRGHQASVLSDGETNPEKGRDLPKFTLPVRAESGTQMFRLPFLGPLYCSLDVTDPWESRFRQN